MIPKLCIFIIEIPVILLPHNRQVYCLFEVIAVVIVTGTAVAELVVATEVAVAAAVAAAAAALRRRHSVVRDTFAGASTSQEGLEPLGETECGIGGVGMVAVLPRTTALPVVSLASGKWCCSPCVGASIGG